MPAVDPAMLRRSAEDNVRRELDEMTVDGLLPSSAQEADRLAAAALGEEPTYVPSGDDPADDDRTVVVPRERVEASRRMTFAALRALPARVSSLPPPPPRRQPEAPAIQGVPIIAVGEPAAEPAPVAIPAAAAEAPAPSKRIPLPAPTFPAPAQLYVDARPAFSSVPPLSYSIPDEPPPPSLRQKRAGRARLAVACAVWAVLLGGAALVATGHLGQRPEPQAMATPESAAPAPRPAPKPVAAAPAAAAEQEVPSVEDLPDEPAAASPATAAAKPAPAPQAAAARPAKAPEHKIEIDSLFFGHAAEDRSVTMKLDGKEVIVREGDVAEDLQVETILPDGVVFKRGNRRFAVYKQ